MDRRCCIKHGLKVSQTQPIARFPTTDKRCPQGWQYFDGTDSCYWLRDFTYDQGYWKLVDYQLADEGCKKMSAQLVSIHSEEEDDFVYDLISSYVGNMTNVVVNNGNPCAYLMVWSGLYSKGAINDGWWSDGTPVDYLGIGVYPMGLGYQWLLRNDRSCGRAEWEPNNSDRYFARYVCKIRSE
ncbi:unnamed protein product, partial [Mesorhabditis belari]|uniref:C-type lectin domain-containing protein n=1 Tax=Mesorhabditis belari TaxID=2138241 RepID=A0AAF3EKW5_9BILA